MKIISRGVVPQDKVYQSVCAKCKTVFEFSQKEGRVANDRNENVVIINCPVCKKSCSVRY